VPARKKTKNCGGSRSHIVNNVDNNKTTDKLKKNIFKYDNDLIMKEKKEHNRVDCR
jgi:hypothetical protein